MKKDSQSNRDGGGSGPETNLQEGPGKDRLPVGDNWCTRKAPKEPGIEASRISYGLEARRNSTRSSGGQRDWKS